jgi:hypothetical protein
MPALWYLQPLSRTPAWPPSLSHLVQAPPRCKPVRHLAALLLALLHAAHGSHRMRGVRVHRPALHCIRIHGFRAAAIFYPNFYPKRQCGGIEMSFLLATAANRSGRPGCITSLSSWSYGFDSRRPLQLTNNFRFGAPHKFCSGRLSNTSLLMRYFSSLIAILELSYVNVKDRWTTCRSTQGASSLRAGHTDLNPPLSALFCRQSLSGSLPS